MLRSKYDKIGEDGNFTDSFRRWINKDFRDFQQTTRWQIKNFGVEKAYRFWVNNYNVDRNGKKNGNYYSNSTIKDIIEWHIKQDGKKKTESILFQNLFLK